MRWLSVDDVNFIQGKVETWMKRDFRSARNAAAVWVCVNTGLRIEELRLMTWGDVWPEKGMIRVRRGKRAKARSVEVPFLLLDWLESFRERWSVGSGPDEPMFRGRCAGGYLSVRGMRYGIMQFLSACGFGDASPHDLRRTYATCLYIASGRDLEFVRLQLGHDDQRTTWLYIRMAVNRRGKALEKLFERG